MKILPGLMVLVCTLHAEEARLYLQLGHSNSVRSVAFSPDGRFVLTGSVDKTARLWDIATGRELQRFEGHAGPVETVAFSPDGQSVLTGSWDDTARMWNTTTGREIRRFQGHAGRVLSVAYLLDGRAILTGSLDRTARLWDVATGRELQRFVGHTGPVYSVAVSPDGHSLLTGSGDKTARLWDLAAGQEIRRLEGHSSSVRSVSFSSNGQSLLTGSEDTSIRLWDVATGQEVRRFEGHSKTVNSVRFSRGGRFVLTCSDDRTARIWELATGKELRRFEVRAGLGLTNSAEFSPDANSVLTGSWDGIARLWDIATGKEVYRFQGHSEGVLSVAVSSDMRSLVTGSPDDTARLWDIPTGREVRRFRGHSNLIRSVAFSPDGQSLLTASDDKTARLWDVANGREIWRFQGHSAEVYSVAFSPDGRFVITGSHDKTARLLEAATGREIRRFEVPTASVMSVKFSPDGHAVLAGCADKVTRLWDAGTGEELQHFEGPSELIESVAFSPDGHSVLTGGWDKIARLWDAATGRELRSFRGHTNNIESVAYSPDGQTVLTGSSDNTARLWDASTGREIRRLEGHSYVVNSVAFSPDGRIVLTGSEDSTVKLWSAGTGLLLATLVSFRDGSWAVVDPEGRYDASDPEHIEGLYWRVGAFRAIGLSQLRRFFYTKELLAGIVRGDTQPTVRGLTDIANLPPAISASITGDRAHPGLQVKLTDIDHGRYGRVMVRVNGRPFAAPQTGGGRIDGMELLLLSLKDAGFAEGENRITVTATSVDNLIESDPAVLLWTHESAARGTIPNPAPSSEKPGGCAGKFYGIFVGAGTFPFASDLNLKYPESDAKALAAAVRLGAAALCGEAQVDFTTLTTDNPDPSLKPTKENIRRVFQEVTTKSTRKDLLFVYLAGHGATSKNDAHSYFFLTQDARQVNVDIADKLRETTTVSVAEMSGWLLNPHLPDKQVLILDTCAAGAANLQLSMLSVKSRSEHDDLNKTVDNFNLDTGTYILMGSAVDRASFESDRFRHGLMTYALLRGMKGDALIDGSRLEASHWFDSTIQAVEKYATMIGREQKPVKGVTSAEGGVPVGWIPTAVREQIVLSDPTLEILRLSTCFQEPVNGPLRDPLKLAAMIRSELRSLATGSVSYNDNVSEGPSDALTPQVRYRVTGANLRVTIDLLQGEKSLKEATITVPAGSLESAAKQIAAAILKSAAR